MAEGIDVYGKYQTVTDWAAVRRAGKSFVYIKVSDGVTTRDDYGYTARARAAGLKVGGYHYAQFGNAVTQARILCNRVRALGATDGAPMLDIEDPFTPGRDAAQFAVAFLTEVKAQGHRPGIYGNNHMLSGILPTVRAAVPDVAVWAARYSTTQPTVGYDIWQYSQTGRVPGITGAVDLNRGSFPANRTATPKGATGLSFIPVRLPSGKGRHVETFSVEVGATSGIITDMWVSLVSGFDGLSNVNIIFPREKDYGPQGWIRAGNVAKDKRRWWKLPSGAVAVSIDYTCVSANSRPAVSFGYREK